MNILGLSCVENARDSDPDRLVSGAHNSAACLMIDGQVIAAAEEERFNRVKNTGAFPEQAARFCLSQAGLDASDLDEVAVSWRRSTIESEALRAFDTQRKPEVLSAEAWIRTGCELIAPAAWDRIRVSFHDHHTCHALSVAGWYAPFDGLVVTLDAHGDGASGSVWTWQEGQGRLLAHMPMAQGSLGLAYLVGCRFLGYGEFEEYKAMGLAPFGNPDRYAQIFSRVMTVSDQGLASTPSIDRIYAMLNEAGLKRLQPLAATALTNDHKDIAASLQRAFEGAFLELLQVQQRATGKTRIALSGGVAQNCAAVGALLRSGLFDEVLLAPASHDGGLCLGAAWGAETARPENRNGPPSVAPASPYLGTDLPKGDDLARDLELWTHELPGVSLSRPKDIVRTTAAILAKGGVVGWVQGRAEFGPRSLGHRSILADPRPAQNRSRINQLIKFREGFRPFAPMTLDAYLGDYFELPVSRTVLDYMNVVLLVRPEKRSELGAVTHVDGTARVQTLNRFAKPATRHLIEHFRELTGCGVLLNTSFNNHAEPIVDGVQDAMSCFLTSRLHHLAIGEFLLTKDSEPEPVDFAAFAMRLPSHRRLVVEGAEPNKACIAPTQKSPSTSPKTLTVSDDLCRILVSSGNHRPIRFRLAETGIHSAHSKTVLLNEILELWRQRALELVPAAP